MNRPSKIENWNSKRVLDLLGAYESRNVTFVEPDGSWPIVWERARGVHVWDAEGRKYLDLTAAFGVAATGHANPRVVKAGQEQMARLLHAMGDVHPHAPKGELARELSRITFERWTQAVRSPPVLRGTAEGGKSEVPSRYPASGIWNSKSTIPDTDRIRGKTIFCNSGFEAVEAALKTALLATGRPGVIAFRGAYHGLGYGALNVTYREHFRSPFRPQLRLFAHFLPFPAATTPANSRSSLRALEASIRGLFRHKKIGAILAEPIQTRGGVNVPHPGFLPMLRRLCDEHRATLILDEIYTGFGRTGKWFACEHWATAPDIVCLGKALTGGFPLSACVGRADLMDAAWPASSGEAIHTSTFLGHPVGCAMALAQIKEIKRLRLVERSAVLGQSLLSLLSCLDPRPAGLSLEARGLGLLAGLDVRSPQRAPATLTVLSALKRLLRRGFIFLPEGEHSNVISFSPPLTISMAQVRAAVEALRQVLRSR